MSGMSEYKKDGSTSVMTLFSHKLIKIFLYAIKNVLL